MTTLEKPKAKIYKIGTFDSNGMPTGWGFNCGGEVAAYEFLPSNHPNESVLVGGYTIAELRAIADQSKAS